MATPRQTYISEGRVLSAPPLSVRLRTAGINAYNILGLYVTTLFALDPYNAAADSRFSVTNRSATALARDAPRGAAGGRGSGGNGPYGGGNGSGGGRKLGTVDDVRGPECKSCG
ncbi:MAG: hypothetical protein M1824_004184 [Vezdaea acicularis]|nr:MAG: hypothetical protein M1824_004184 [Vezdaea acicularis]